MHIQRPPHLWWVCPGFTKTAHEARLNYKEFFKNSKVKNNMSSEEGTQGGWGATARTWWMTGEMAAQSLQDLSLSTGVWCVHTPWALQLQLVHTNNASISASCSGAFEDMPFQPHGAQPCTVLTQDQKVHHRFMQSKESSPVWTFSKALTASDWHIRGSKTLPSFFSWEQNLPSLSCKHLNIA